MMPLFFFPFFLHVVSVLDALEGQLTQAPCKKKSCKHWNVFKASWENSNRKDLGLGTQFDKVTIAQWSCPVKAWRFKSRSIPICRCALGQDT